MKFRTCHHVYDNGCLCQAAAATDRDHCGYHLRQIERLMRMAQARARQSRRVPITAVQGETSGISPME